MSVTGPVEGAPTKAGIALADVTAGKDASIAILGALVARSRAAEPLPLSDRRLFVSLYHSAAAALVNVGAETSWCRVSLPVAGGNGHPNLVPYQLFHARDRYLVVAVGNDGQWQGCCRALGLHALGTDSDVATNSGRLAHRERVVAAMTARLAERTAEEWIALLEKEGVPCGVVQSVGDALAPLGASPLTGVPPSVPGTVRLPPPTLDEHGVLVREFGWDAFSAGSSVTRGMRAGPRQSVGTANRVAP